MFFPICFMPLLEHILHLFGHFKRVFNHNVFAKAKDPSIELRANSDFHPNSEMFVINYFNINMIAENRGLVNFVCRQDLHLKNPADPPGSAVGQGGGLFLDTRLKYASENMAKAQKAA